MSPETGAFGLSPFVTVKPPIKLTNADYDDLYHEHGMYDPQTKQYEKYKGGFDIERRSGVQERRFFSENTNKVAIASECLDRLMQATDASRRNTVFLLASSRPDIQNIAEKVHTKMNVDGEGINWACSTFAAAIRQAIDVHRGQKDVAIVTLEMWGDLINILDRNMCLFGDGVYGTLLTEDTSRQMLRVHDAHVEFYDPESVDRAATGDVIVQSTQNALGPTRRMSKHNAFSINGRLIYRVAPKKMLATAEEGLRANNTDLQEIDALLPHGANLNMVELILEALNERGILYKGKREWTAQDIWMDIRERGNSGCSTIPDFIYHHPEKFKQPGKKIALTLAGAGQMLDPDTMTGGFAWVETV